MAGGNVRVGLEDNIYLDRGVLASNGDLVERAAVCNPYFLEELDETVVAVYAA